MKKHIVKTVEVLACVGFLVAVFLYTQKVLVPKFYTDRWKVTATYQNFYREPENSLQVLFLGSSFGSTSFIPQELYDEYGYTSYNLCCEQQSLVTSYYWLKEALAYQQPQVVVLETGLLFGGTDGSVLESSEEMTRAAFDPMRWSKVKWEGVRDVCRLDPEHTMTGYLFPYYRYHDRWREISEEDFMGNKEGLNRDLRGYVYIEGEVGESSYEPLYPGVDQWMDMKPVMEEYFNRIVDLCAEKGIYLMLVRTPTTSDTYGAYNCMQQVSTDRGLLFFDFNDYRFYGACGYDYLHDNADDSHPNLSGARKLTDFVGQILRDVYFLSPVEAESFETAGDEWQQRV